MRQVILALIGMCIGGVVAGGVCALITSIGVIVKISYKSKTTEYIKLYENVLLAGAVISNYIYVGLLNGNGKTIADSIRISMMIPGNMIAAVTGLFMGVFVGCLALSLAETLDVFTIFLRRIRLKKYLGILILIAAAGKFIGNIIYFCL